MGRTADEEVGEPKETAGRPQAIPSPDRLRLVVLSGASRGRELLIERGTYRVGKDPRCSLALADEAVSRQHLELQVGPGGIVARDLASKNGCYLDGARFGELTVNAGMTITIGETELRFLLADVSTPLLPSEARAFGLLIGQSLAMRELYAVLERAAPTPAAVLIEGETGTGKELCAESIHRLSARAEGPFVVVDLAATAAALIDSELFGHRRGAFTGADRDREGAFAGAAGGTIFLDEVGELPLAVQSRLLRVLAERKVRRLGDNVYQPVDVRVVAATNRNLAEECKAGRFREDLYHRLAVIRVRLPSLRQRLDDLPLLVRHLLSTFLRREVALGPMVPAMLAAYHWPGNVRELKNVLERAVALLGPEDVLSPAMLGIDAQAGDVASETADFFATKERLIEAWERRYLEDLLTRAAGGVTRAAALSGINRPYLHRLLKKHGLGGARET